MRFAISWHCSTFTAKIIVAPWERVEELLSVAMLTNDIDSKDFAARVTLTIEDISDPLRIEHPEQDAAESEAQ